MNTIEQNTAFIIFCCGVAVCTAVFTYSSLGRRNEVICGDSVFQRVAYKIGAQDNDPVKMYTADICTVTVNIAGLPAINTTCGYNADGMPIGMSMIGKRFDEAALIQAADAFEQQFSPVRCTL